MAFDAWYMAKKADGTWDFVWQTKLPVLAWDRDEHGTTGFVQAPSGEGADAAYLVPANDAVVSGSDGRRQYFVRYMTHA